MAIPSPEVVWGFIFVLTPHWAVQSQGRGTTGKQLCPAWTGSRPPDKDTHAWVRKQTPSAEMGSCADTSLEAWDHPSQTAGSCEELPCLLYHSSRGNAQELCSGHRRRLSQWKVTKHGNSEIHESTRKTTSKESVERVRTLSPWLGCIPAPLLCPPN